MRRPLTSLAHTTVQTVLNPGGRAVDATMGNGHDTCFLASQVAPHGRVIAFDVQPQAVAETRERLGSAGLEHLVTLQLCGHEKMTTAVPHDWPGKVDVVMFNLGYLPGSNKTIVTQAGTTLTALNQALQLLRPGGLLSLLLYRDHGGAASESNAVENWVKTLADGYTIERYESPGPCLFLIGTP